MMEKDLSPNNSEGNILRYKVIYSTVALILGFTAVASGLWLGSLEAYHTEVSGWLLNIFGCAILYNENNMAPSFFFILVGLFLIFITPYKLKADHKPKVQNNIDKQSLFRKFIYSISGLIVGFFSTIFGIVLAENLGNACPADWARKITSYYNIFCIAVIFFLVGTIMVINASYRIRTFDSFGEIDTN